MVYWIKKGRDKIIFSWLAINIITVLLIVLWSSYRGADSNYILLGKIAAEAAFCLFLININMYFVFLLIRQSKVRNVKVKLAKLSKENDEVSYSYCDYCFAAYHLSCNDHDVCTIGTSLGSKNNHGCSYNFCSHHSII